MKVLWQVMCTQIGQPVTTDPNICQAASQIPMGSRRHLPFNYIHKTLRAILDGHPRNQIDQLMPWIATQPASLAA